MSGDRILFGKAAVEFVILPLLSEERWLRGQLK
jgi:hypothetical protein